MHGSLTGFLAGVVFLVVALPVCAGEKPQRPNIVVILADDLGYADLGFNGCKDIPTPNLDRLAARSVRCTSGYVSHPFCSPTRAGLLTGRYQQRFGHENNPAWLPDDAKVGLPLSQVTLAQVLRDAGYRTGCVGKWHLGGHPSFHPNQRGFDQYFGLLGGGHVYTPGTKGGVEYTIPMDRNGKKEPLEGYLTDVLGREAAAFIHENKKNPFFLYLAFNAPHTPLHTDAAYLAKVAGIEDEARRNLAAMVVGLDAAVGLVLNALADAGLENDTIVWFLSDNGGPITVTRCSNGVLRAGKGTLFEGGVRVPFLVSWPGHLPRGQDYPEPVISLDLFVSAVAVVHAKVPASHPLDGVDILPYLAGKKKGTPHERLFWRADGGKRWAVREGRWKLVDAGDGQLQLFDLQTDIGETKNLADRERAIVDRLHHAYQGWNRSNIAPLFESPMPKKAKPAP